MRGTRETKRQRAPSQPDPRRSRSPATPTPASRRCSTGSPAPGVLVEDSLFATLDPTTRRTTTADGRVYTMSDTVGFVRHLPHQLVEAFRSTLEEVAESDLILHVVDGSHPDPEGQLGAVREVLAEIGAADVPELVVINKADVADPMVLARLRQREPHSVVVSAKTGEGIAEVLAASRPSCPARRRVQGAAALRARRPDQPDPPARRDRLDGAHRRRDPRRRSRQRGPRRRARGLRRLSHSAPGAASVRSAVRAIRRPRMPNANITGSAALPIEVTCSDPDRQRDHQRQQAARAATGRNRFMSRVMPSTVEPSRVSSRPGSVTANATVNSVASMPSPL